MNKLAVSSILGLLLMAISVPPAYASKRYCVHLTNFCETLQISTSAHNSYGLWDVACDGTNLAPVIGRASTGVITAAGHPEGFRYTHRFVFDRTTYLFNQLATDGTSIFAVRVNEPFTITKGACSVNNGKPSFTGVQ